MKPPKLKKSTPYDFVLEALYTLHPRTNPMFGCTAVYVGEKIVFVLREKEDHTQDNGVWIATTREHHESLKKDFPTMRSIGVLGPPPTGWQILPADNSNFEVDVVKACELVLRKDSRIGKVPARKKLKSIDLARNQKITKKKKVQITSS